MRRATILMLMIAFLLAFGCVEQHGFSGTQVEQITSNQSVDVNNDSIPDYIVYNYQPVTVTNAGMTVQRQVTVSVTTQATFTSIKPNLTDVDLLVADSNLNDFSNSAIQSDAACSQAIGLSNVVCSDVITCNRLCSAASQSCRNIASKYDEPLAGSMISYVAANNEMRSLILDSRRMVVTLRNASMDQKNAFLGKTMDIVAQIGNINANPLYNSPDLQLCSHDDYGVSSINSALAMIGNYTVQPSSYHYRVILSVKPISTGASAQDGSQVAGISLTDKIPLNAVSQPDQISSLQQIDSSSDPLNILVSWSSAKASNNGYVLYYEFDSNQSPDQVLGSMRTPDLTVKSINLAALGPTLFLMNTVYGITKNYYVSMGAALGLTIALIFIIYNVLVLLLTVVSERAAGANITAAFRKAFGRTIVSWKTDIIIAIILLAGGFYVASVMAVQPPTPPQLLDSIDFLLQNGIGAVAIAVILLGVVLAYFAFENFVKLIILERAYGMVIRQEKDLFLAKNAALRDKLKELETLIEEYTKEDFDVSKEYDVLNSVRSEKMDSIAKEMTARTKTIVEENLAKVENAVGSLKERKKIADDNWPKWKASIAKMLDEQNEVFTSSLVTIPSSLRSWALGRYVREEGSEGISFDRDALKKKKVTPAELVKDMIDRGLINGAIVMKQDKVIISEFAEGSSTIMTALALKLNSYLQSLSKNLGQGTQQSFMASGDKKVVLIMKSRTIDSILFVNKDKVDTALDQWKAKMKIFEAG